MEAVKWPNQQFGAYVDITRPLIIYVSFLNRIETDWVNLYELSLISVLILLNPGFVILLEIPSFWMIWPIR